MNPGALPPALSDLMLPEAKVDQTGQTTTGTPSDGDADRFERYLVSARQTVGADQALPVPARADDASTGRREPNEGPSRPERTRSRSRRDDRRPVADRTADRADRPGPDDKRTDRSDDDTRSTGAATDHDRADDSSRVDRTDAEGADTTETEGASDQTEVDASENDGGETSTVVDGELRPTATVLGPVLMVDQVTAGEAADGGLATAGLGQADLDGTDGVIDDGSDEVDSTVVKAGLAESDTGMEQAIDPAAAAAASVAVGAMADVDGPIGPDPEATDLEGGDGPSTGLAEGAGDATVGRDETEADLFGEASGDEQAGDEGDRSGQANAGDDGVIETSTSDEAAQSDGPDTAPIIGQAASQGQRGATVTTGGSTAGTESVGAVAGPRARATGPATTAPTQGADGPVVDGDPADPLWLQVRRAIGSLRSLQNGEQQLTIRLRPAELGSVVVRVNAGDNGTTVSLMAESAVAATQLTQQRQQLISELEQGGLADVAVDVATEDNPDHRPEGGSADGGDSGDGGADGSAAAAAVAGATAPTADRSGSRRRRSGGSSGGLVDVEL